MVTVCTLVFQIILQLILFFLEKFQPASCYSIQFCRYLGQKIAILHIFLIVQLSTADLCKTLLIFEIAKINRFPFPALFEPLYFLKLCPILDELKFLGIMLNLGQKSYFLRPTIFKIPQPNWYYSIQHTWASAAVWHFSIMLMSAPAMKHPSFPEIKTTALIEEFDWHSLKMASMSAITSSFKEFIFTPEMQKDGM